MKNVSGSSGFYSGALLYRMLLLITVIKIGQNISSLKMKQPETGSHMEFSQCVQNYSDANHKFFAKSTMAAAKRIPDKGYKELFCSWNVCDKNSTKISVKEYSAMDILLHTIVTLVILVMCSNMLSFRKSKFLPQSKLEKNNLYSYDFVFELGTQSIFEIRLYQFSLRKYLNEIESKRDKNIRCMHHEWARYESFKTFPENCPVSTMRLSQAGFYYAGKGVEAVCFCCGLKNEKWTENESVMELHKRLSPDCKFIKGEKTDNVPINGTEESADTVQKKTDGACGGPGDVSSSERDIEKEETNDQRNEQSRNRNLEQSRNRNLEQSRNRDRDEVYQETEQNLDHRYTPTCNSHQNALESEGYSFRRNSDFRPTVEIQHFPGIVNEQPKHPDYAIKSVRLSSFAQWLTTHVMKPEDLAEAGFFFLGMQDLVRCFFCGGGVKNWEYGDSPWIEHARWFPACAYLKQCKGEEFVNLCQMSNMTFPTQTNFELRDFDSQQANIVDDQCITDLNSSAAKLILDMGYTQTQVEDAIKQTRHRIGQTEELKAQYLLEYLLDNSYTQANTSTTTSLTTASHHSDTSTTVDQQSAIMNNRDQSSPEHSSQSNQCNDTTERISSELRTGSPTANKSLTADKDERQSLKKENRHLKEQMMCKICMDKDANMVFLPCGHLVSCVECAHALRKCAVCRAVIQGTVRTYPA